MVSTSSLPAVAGFLGQNYNYKSVAIQIPHGARKAPIPYTGQNVCLKHVLNMYKTFMEHIIIPSCLSSCPIILTNDMCWWDMLYVTKIIF